MKMQVNGKEVTDPKKENKFGILFGLVFFLAGFGVLIASFVKFIDAVQLSNSGITAPAVVVEINSHRDSDGNRMYSPVFEFTDASGRTYQVQDSMSSSSPAYSVGEQTEIKYIQGKEQSAKVNSFVGLWVTPIALFVFGGIFALVGGAIMGFYIKDIKKRKFLATNGKPITADISAVDFVNADKGRDYWVIRAQWHDSMTNTIYGFDSDFLYINPAAYVKDKVTVLIDPKDPKRYLVDLSFMPKIAN